MTTDIVPSIADFGFQAPESWFKDRQRSSVWISVYRMAMASAEHLPPKPSAMDLADVRVILHWGKVRYTSQGRFELSEDYQLKLDASQFKDEVTVHGAWLALVTPLSIDGAPQDEPAARRRLEAALGLLMAMNGQNVAYEQLCENAFEFAGGKLHTFSQVFRSPHSLPPPALLRDDLRRTLHATYKLSELAAEPRARVQLSLIWYRQAIEAEGVDSYLKSWIALEVLAMPDTTHIQPINTALAGAYGISREQAESRFMVGRLFGLRSHIVHNGLIPALHSAVVQYLEWIYVDVLTNFLDVAPKGCAGTWLKQHGQEIEAQLTRILVGRH